MRDYLAMFKSTGLGIEQTALRWLYLLTSSSCACHWTELALLEEASKRGGSGASSGRCGLGDGGLSGQEVSVLRCKFSVVMGSWRLVCVHGADAVMLEELRELAYEVLGPTMDRVGHQYWWEASGAAATAAMGHFASGATHAGRSGHALPCSSCRPGLEAGCRHGTEAPVCAL